MEVLTTFSNFPILQTFPEENVEGTGCSENQAEKSPVPKMGPLETSSLTTDATIMPSVPARLMNTLSGSVNSPSRILLKPAVAMTPPMRVTRKPCGVAFGTPINKQTAGSFTPRKTVSLWDTPFTPPSRVRREPGIGLCTPSRVPMSENSVKKRQSLLVTSMFVKKENENDDVDDRGNKEYSGNTSPEVTQAANKNPTTAVTGKAEANASNMDIRSFWKTKKTPNKSPVMKEVLTKEVRLYLIFLLIGCV